jgi:transposase
MQVGYEGRKQEKGPLIVVEGTAYATERLDHLGIVAGVCEQIGLKERVDQQVGETRRRVTVGQSVQAMVLNGLGFVGRPLYLTPEFLKQKPVDVLVGEGLEAEDFNDDSLGRALDALFESGVTEVFAQVAAGALVELGIEANILHLDSTSFALHGEYEGEAGEEREAIRITHGYSRDHRPDLKQAVLALLCTHQASLPVWLEALDGNRADAGSFPMIVDAYLEQLGEEEEPPYFVADTALYSAGTLQQLEDVRWVTRVSATLTEAQALFRAIEPEQMRETSQGDYRVWTTLSDYGDVAQRWVLVYSEATQKREMASLRRHIDKERQEAEKGLRRLGRREYPTEEAALAAVETLADLWRFHQAAVQLEAVPHYHQRGRPAVGQAPDYVTWQPVGEAVEDEAVVEQAARRRGKFIMATNVLDGEQLSDEALIELYKGQNATVERGFRFLKDPLFFAHSLFLKKPARIMALLMVMGLSLLVYACAEHILRRELVARDETLPNQVGKPTQCLTMRRVFQIFEGIDILTIRRDGGYQRIVLNLTDLRLQILALLGLHVQKCYLFSS